MGEGQGNSEACGERSSEITRETKQAREGRAGEREKDTTSEAATATETATET